MAIKKFYSTKAKAGWRSNGKKFWSYGYDIYLESGKRKRESGFATKDLATSAAARIKLGEKNKKYELTDARKFPLVKCSLKSNCSMLFGISSGSPHETATLARRERFF